MKRINAIVDGTADSGHTVKIQHHDSWVCFTTAGRVYVEEDSKVVQDNLASLPAAFSWVNSFGSRR